MYINKITLYISPLREPRRANPFSQSKHMVPGGFSHGIAILSNLGVWDDPPNLGPGGPSRGDPREGPEKGHFWGSPGDPQKGRFWGSPGTPPGGVPGDPSLLSKTYQTDFPAQK